MREGSVSQTPSCVSSTGAIDAYECLYNMIHMRKAKWGTDDRETRESHDRLIVSLTGQDKKSVRSPAPFF